MASRAQGAVLVALAALAVAGGTYAYLDGEPRSARLTLYGNVDVREVDLAFNVAGRVATMLVEEGEPVDAGDLLARLEATRYEAEVAAAEARVAAQKAILDRLLAGSREEEIRQAQARVAAIEAALEEARVTLERTTKLVPQGFASQQKLDSDRARVESLEAELKAAQEALALAVKGPRREEIAEARARLEAERAALALARDRLGDTELFAPERATVLTRVVEPGAVVLANSPVYTLALSDPVFVRTYVDEPNLGRVYPGQPAQVFTDTLPGRPYEGWVGFIAPIAEFTPKTVETPELRTSLVYRVRVYVKNPDLYLRQGMPVTVAFPLAEGARAEETRRGPWWQRLRAWIVELLP